MDTMNKGVHWVKDFLRDYDFTVSRGYDFSITPGIFQIDIMPGIAADSDGNIGLQVTVGAAVTIGMPSIGFQEYYSVTNAPDITYLEKEGVSLGGSFAIMIEKLAAVLGIDLNLLGNPNEKIEYWGMTVSAGIASDSGFELHAQPTYTRTIKKINLFDLWDYLYNMYYGRGRLYRPLYKCCGALE